MRQKEVELQQKYEDDHNKEKEAKQKELEDEKLKMMRKIATDTDLSTVLQTAIDNWCKAWWKNQELGTAKDDLKDKLKEMDSKHLCFPSNTRGFQPRELGDLEALWSKTMGKKTTIEIEFPPDLTIRDAMRIMYHTNIRMQYNLQAEAVSKKLEEIKASVTADGFKGLLSEVRKNGSMKQTRSSRGSTKSMDNWNPQRCRVTRFGQKSRRVSGRKL